MSEEGESGRLSICLGDFLFFLKKRQLSFEPSTEGVSLGFVVAEYVMCQRSYKLAGRSRYLHECLLPLPTSFWLYYATTTTYGQKVSTTVCVSWLGYRTMNSDVHKAGPETLGLGCV